MSDKREERRQRAEQARLLHAQQARQSTLGRRVLLILGAILLVGLAYAATTRGRAAGRVWSPEHQHWHDRT